MRLTEQVHLKLREWLNPGDTAIDATAGNGHDTLAMAGMVGPTGKVIAIDLQSVAIESTRMRLADAGQVNQCNLILGDHADVLNDLLPEHHSCAAAITFNLGYLPGGKREVTTLPGTTLRALDAAKSLIKTGGALLVTAYRGHAGGLDEAAHVESWMRSLSKGDWQTEIIEPRTRQIDRIPPILWVARRIS